MLLPPRPFRRSKGVLTCDGIALDAIAAAYGTPLHVYSGEWIRKSYRALARAFRACDPMIAYSVKANSNGAILRLLAGEGAAFDIVSGGELERVLRAGVAADRVIFAGVGKSRAEMEQALRAGVCEFNVESEAEALRLNDVATALGLTAPVAIRVNPNVDARTHRHITTGKKENKFGLDGAAVLALAASFKELPGISFQGLHAHIGSQITDPRPHVLALEGIEKLLAKLEKLGMPSRTLNLGGGFGIGYSEGAGALDLGPVAKAAADVARRRGVRILLEPGRALIGPAGALLTRVEYIKRGRARVFAIVDAAMTELIRPALYGAHHEVVHAGAVRGRRIESIDVVGPVCETADTFAARRPIPAVREGDLLAILDTGAYGSVMASRYNSRPIAAEVLTLDGVAHLVRERETIEDLVQHEIVPRALCKP